MKGIGAESPQTVEVQIGETINALVDGWNRHDMAALSAQFTEDADHVNVIGMHARGRAEIKARHEAVHRTIFRNSVLRLEKYTWRRLADGVVLAHIEWQMTGQEGVPGVLSGEVRHGVATAIFIDQEGRWLFRAFHNTDIVPVSIPGAKKQEA